MATAIHTTSVRLVALGAMLLLLGGCRKTETPKPTGDGKQNTTKVAPEENAPIQGVKKASAVTNRPIQVSANGYVGAEACRDCHPDNHKTWHASYHRTMTQVATPESVVGDFNNVRFQSGDSRITLRQRDNDFFVELDVPSRNRPGERTKATKPIVMTTGSHHMQLYWFALGEETRTVGQLRYAYLLDEKRWIPRDSAFLQNHPNGPSGGVGEIGRWNHTCIRCHATGGLMRPSDVQADNSFDIHSVDTHVGDFGISCEACHGPGKAHIEAQQDSQTANDESAIDSIVNPRNLSHKLSSQVCGQCHSVFGFRKSKNRDVIIDWANEGYEYRPGDNLEESAMRFLIRGTLEKIPHDEKKSYEKDPYYFSDRFWPDGMIRVSGREYNGLIESTCYQKGEMSCFSCHRMHQQDDDTRDISEWADDQLQQGMRSNQACIQCHQELANDAMLVEHTHHAVESTGSNCYNCHMPHTTYGLLKAIRSHEISSPSVATTLRTGRPNACNQCHLDKTLKWTSEYLDQWYEIDKPDLPIDHQKTAASIVWSLRGDAGQRSLMAWSFGWKAAQDASEVNWMAPYLARLLSDPYDAIRLIAARSLRTLPSNQRSFDPLDVDQVNRAINEVMNRWSRVPNRKGNSELLIDEVGKLMVSEFQRLGKQRNDRPVNLQE